MQNYLLLFLGVAIGTFGTLIGAGGGFILVPILLFMYPEKTTDQITSISLATVFFNAVSGSVAYARKKKIDYRSGWAFAAASIPGAIIGANITKYIERQVFDLVFGIALIVVGFYLFLRPMPKRNNEDIPKSALSSASNLRKGVLISLVVGFVSSILGIGGGIIHVPAMVHFLSFPVHFATATSHFVLSIMTFFGSLVHWFDGTLSEGTAQILFLAPGVLIGAQIGAHLSTRFQGKSIVRNLALALTLVGLRLLFK